MWPEFSTCVSSAADTGELLSRAAEPVSSKTARVVTSPVTVSCVVAEGSSDARATVWFLTYSTVLAAGGNARRTVRETDVVALKLSDTCLDPQQHDWVAESQ